MVRWQGTAFGPNGTTYAFANYGTGPAGVNIATGFGGTLQGTPPLTAAARLTNGSASTPGSVVNCIVQFCIGGELDNQTGSGVTLATPLTRGNVYTRLSYDLTPDTEIFMTYNWSEVGTSNIPNPDMWLGSLPGIGGGAGQVNAASSPTTSQNSLVLTASALSNPVLLQPGTICYRRPASNAAMRPAVPTHSCRLRSRQLA